MKNLATKRLKLIEVQSASTQELLEAQHKVAVSNGSNWEMLSYNRGILDRELSKRAATKTI